MITTGSGISTPLIKKIMKYIALVLFTLLSSCLIEKLPPRKDTDGFVNLKTKDKAFLRPFNLANYNTSKNFDEKKKKLTFEEVQTTDIQMIAKQNKLTLMIIWATWCSHCYNNLPVCISWFDNMSEKGLNLLLVAQNYNIKNATKELLNDNYHKQTYILSNAYFGDDEFKKQEKAKHELNIPFDGHNIVPTQILLDQNGKTVYMHQGELKDRDTIMYYVNQVGMK